ncbi:MAG: enoyl-CoA hydratase/isomerase family protein [Hyphomicrobiaceae bacterium]|nr:enoyl-CoA hydratase/isomerase family protein [Hyphomicrobiaceae bacterium]
MRVDIETYCGDAKVARVTVDNERRLNCLSTPIIVALRVEFEALARDGELRAVILTGAGDKAFIGGADLKELGALAPDSARLFITNLHKACLAIRSCPVPVIARIQGFTLGAGLEIAASADIRVASETAVLGMPEVVMGLPSVIEAALLPRLIGWGKTNELLLTGDTLEAAEARGIGLVEHAVPPSELDAKVGRLVEAICRAAPQAVRSQKALITRWEQASIAEGVYAGIDALSDAYRTGEPQSRIAAFFKERARSKGTSGQGG